MDAKNTQKSRGINRIYILLIAFGTLPFLALLLMSIPDDDFILNPTVEQLQGVYQVEPGVYDNDSLGASITLWPDGRCEVVNVPGGMVGSRVITDHIPTGWESIGGSLWGCPPIRYNFTGNWEIHPEEHRDIRLAYVELVNNGVLQQEGFSRLHIYYYCETQSDSIVIAGLRLSHPDDISYIIPKISSFK